MFSVNTSATRAHRNWQTGEVFTVNDATELYEVDRWGKGYFSISQAGHVLVHPEKDPSRAIDLKQLTDHLMLRGIQLPVLIRFRDILRHRVGDIHNAFKSAITQHQYEGRLHLRLSDQGEPAAPGRRGGPRFRPRIRLRPRGRLEAGAAGGRRLGVQRHPDHLQRVQGRRVHRDGHARAEDRAHGHSGGREVHRAGPHPEVRREGGRPAEDRDARQACGQGRRTLAGLRRLPIQVRPDRDRSAAGPRGAQGPRHAGLLQAPALPSRQPDSRTSASSRAR